MSRNVLASEMLQRLREATGTENDTHVTNAELYRALSSGVADTWEALYANGMGTENVRSHTFTGAPWMPGSEGELNLDSATDFFRLKGVFVVVAGQPGRPIDRINPAEVYPRQRVTDLGLGITIKYEPCAPVFTTGLETFNGINGWEEHTIQCAAIHIKAKKEDDTGPFRARKRELEERIASMSNRLQDEPPRVTRRHRMYYKNQSMPLRGYPSPYYFNNEAMVYDVEGVTLKLFR